MDPARNRYWRWRSIAALALAVPSCYLAYLLGIALGPTRSTPEVAVASPNVVRLPNGLEAASADLELGEVWEHPQFVRQVTIANRGKSDAAITNLIGGCECTSIEPSNFVLEPGQSRQVNVHIDLTHRFPHQFGLDRRELAVTIHPTLATRGPSAEAWKVTGVIKSRVSLESRGLEFADLCGSGGPSVTRKMRATAHVPLKGLEASVPAEMGRAEVRPDSGKPDRWDILVTPNPDRPLGAYKFDVALTATGVDGVKSPCASFQVQGEMVSPVRIVPSPVLLGEYPVGTKAEAMVSVRFPAPGWSVERVETELEGTMATAIDPIDGVASYRIEQTVSKANDQTVQVRFICRKPSGKLETVAASISCFGLTMKEAAR